MGKSIRLDNFQGMERRAGGRAGKQLIMILNQNQSK